MEAKLLYNIVLVLPYVNMNLPWVYTCSPSWTPLPPPTPYHTSGSFQCISPKHPVSCIEPGLAIRFLYDIIHVSMPFSWFCLFFILRRRSQRFLAHFLEQSTGFFWGRLVLWADHLGHSTLLKTACPALETSPGCKMWPPEMDLLALDQRSRN